MAWYKITDGVCIARLLEKLAYSKFILDLVCDYIGLKNVINKMSGLGTKPDTRKV